MFPFMWNNNKFVEDDTIQYSSHVDGLTTVISLLNQHNQFIKKAKIRSNDCDVKLINEILQHTLVFNTIESLYFDLIAFTRISDADTITHQLTKLCSSILPYLPSLKQLYIKIDTRITEAYKLFIESFDYESNKNIYPKLTFFMICIHIGVIYDNNISFKPLSKFISNHTFNKFGIELQSTWDQQFPFSVYSQLINALINKNTKLKYLHIESSDSIISHQNVELLTQYLIWKGNELSTFKLMTGTRFSTVQNYSAANILMKTLATSVRNINTLHLDLNVKQMQYFIDLLIALECLETLYLTIPSGNIISVSDMCKLFDTIAKHSMLNDVSLCNIWLNKLYIQQLAVLFKNYMFKNLRLGLTTMRYSTDNLTNEHSKTLDIINNNITMNVKQEINDNVITKLLENEILYDCVVVTIKTQLKVVWDLREIFISEILQYLFGPINSNKMTFSMSKASSFGAQPNAWKIGVEFVNKWKEIRKQYTIDNPNCHDFQRKMEVNISWS